MTRVPPPRYQIIERDRRLIVIDRWHGEQATGAESAQDRSPASVGPRQTSFDGRAELVTQRWYDDKAPRTLQIDPGTAGFLSGARWIAGAAAMGLAALVYSYPILIVLLPVFFAKRPREAMRALVTQHLDRFDPR